ncbi:MAG: hypothetical protein GXX09_04965, partial [Syntrophomonadaceae bacterium]|nr:hypothetical protein [Syntrophomonadaceae bacterium]
MRKIYEVFEVTFRCVRDIERRKYKQKGLVLQVEASGRTGKLRIDIRGLTPDVIGRALYRLESQIVRDIDREKAREIVGRVLGVLRKELTIEESNLIMHHYRLSRLTATQDASP